MDLHPFVLAIVGGALIGISASMMLLLVGRIAGICGIVGGLIEPVAGDTLWRAVFVGGLLVGGALLMGTMSDVFHIPTGRSLGVIGVAGMLVGFGTRLGSGCTSGHGVCGLSRLSKRSLVATCTFMGTGFLTATLIQILTGGIL